MSEVRVEMSRNAWCGDAHVVGTSRAGHVGRRLIGLATRVTAAVALLSAIAAAPAGATLPGWGFEQVTPTAKGNGAVALDTFQARQDGNALLYTADLPFEGAPTESVSRYVRYLGTRGDGGWVSRGVDPPHVTEPLDIYNIQMVIGSSDNLKYAFVTSRQALAPGAKQGGSNLYVRATETGEYRLVAAVDDRSLVNGMQNINGEASFKYLSPDGREAMFLSAVPLVDGAPSGGVGVLYSWTADRGVRAESVLPQDEGGAIVDAAYSGNDNSYNVRGSIPTDGGLEHVYFTAFANNQIGPAYVRTGGETRAVSVPRLTNGPSPTPLSAQVDAISPGGRFMLFHVRAGGEALTDDTPPSSSNAPYALYRYDAQDDTLAYVGWITDGQGSDIIQMTSDGQTVAFQSQAQLDPAAVPGERNMYVWRHGETHYVATAEASSFPASSAAGAKFLRVLSEDGRYLSFTDSSPSAALKFGYDIVSNRCQSLFGDPAGCDQVYLFDADTDGGKLVCVSCRTDGGRPVGHSGDPINPTIGTVRLNSHQARTVASDGTVIFGTADPLLAEDRNGQQDVYAYKAGQLRLVSRAKQGYDSRFLDATPDGKTVFIATDDPIVGTDADRSIDIYMTREGAGFPDAAPSVVEPCTGSDCRDATPSPPPSPSPGSDKLVLPEADDRLPSASRVTARVTKVFRRGSVLQVSIRSSTRGVLRVSGAGLRPATRIVQRAGVVVVRVPLTKKLQSRLRTKRRVTVGVRVSVTPLVGRAAVTTHRLTLRK